MDIIKDVVKIRTPKPLFPILKVISKRFSPRVFSKSSIPQNHIQRIFEAARWTPSGRNNQPWFFYCIKKDTEAHKKIKLCIPERNGWALSAPLIIMACYNPFEPKGIPNKWAQYDLGAAVISLILQAQELGYYSRQIGSFDVKETQKQFSIEKNYIPFILIAMGKMGDKKDYKNADKDYVDKDLMENGRNNKIYQDLP